MSASQCDCPCPTPVVTEVPGSPGTNGAAGINAFTTTTALFIVPALGGLVGNVTVEESSWVGAGQTIHITDAGYFQVVAVIAGSLTLQYLDIAQNTLAGTDCAAGSIVTLTGPQLIITPPTSLTDNTGATVSDTLAAGVGIQTLSFFIEATSLANGDILTNYVPGYAFKILKFDARCATPVTTAAKAATLNLEIVSTDLTGGVIQLAGLYAQGAAQAGSAVTANNVGSATDSFSIEASAVTDFMEGAFWLLVSVQNLDTANALASLAGKTNEIITALS